MSRERDIVFDALGDPTRRKIFELLATTGEKNVRTLTNASSVSQPMVSRHLFILREAGLVTDRKIGREKIYRARPAGLRPLSNWMREQSIFWNEKLQALDDLLGRMDS